MRRDKREQFAVNSFKCASETIGEIKKDCHGFAITRGQFSMIDAILATLNQLGPSHISVWTWTIADYEVQVFNRLIIDGRLLSARLMIDNGAQKKNYEMIKSFRNKFGKDSVRFVKNHAKIARVWNDEFKVCLRGSFNLNFNPRFENFDWSEGGPAFELVEAIENDLPILPKDATTSEIYKASGISDAFTEDQLSLFTDKKIKVWNK